jgi:hypothetical protein
MGSLFGGKSSGSSTSIPTLSDEQKQYIKAQTGFFTNTVQPTYQDVLGRGTELYNKMAPGYEKAAQDYGRTAGQAGMALGETGESALRTGVSGLENLFGKNYEQQQVQAALAPAQSQYMQNVANQRAQFGGAGNLGSARQALAERQTAGANQALMAQTAAGVSNQVANQRAAAAQELARLGQGGLGQSMNAYAARLNAAGAPQDLFNRYGTLAFGTPQASYTQIGPYGNQTNTQGTNFGFKMGMNPFSGG